MYNYNYGYVSHDTYIMHSNLYSIDGINFIEHQTDQAVHLAVIYPSEKQGRNNSKGQLNMFE